MMAIIVVYLLYAPRLQRLARARGFVTPGDWVDYRFGSKPLSLLTNLLLVVSIANYLLAQLMAMGHVVAGISGNLIPYWIGVLVLVLVIIIYETLGGLRAVAWTDVVQGSMLLIGLFGLLYAVAPGPAHWQALTDWLSTHAPEKTAVPSGEVAARWFSSILLVGFSGAVYPQAIQRIYAAGSVRALKRSLQWMIFMPLFTMPVVVLVGLVGVRRFTDLDGIAADQIMPMLLREWAQASTWTYMMAVLVVTGILAAIMSTADSVLLSLSSILSKDFRENASKRRARGTPDARGQAHFMAGHGHSRARGVRAAHDALGAHRAQDGNPRSSVACVRAGIDLESPRRESGSCRDVGGRERLWRPGDSRCRKSRGNSGRRRRVGAQRIVVRGPFARTDRKAGRHVEGARSPVDAK